MAADHRAGDLAACVGPWLIRRLRAMQHGGETIREDTPERHRSEEGHADDGRRRDPDRDPRARRCCGRTCATATCGCVMLATAGFGLIGLWDDWSKLRKRRGISARVKFGAAGRARAGACCRSSSGSRGPTGTPVLAIPFFKGWLVNLGWLVDPVRDPGDRGRLERGEPHRRARRPRHRPDRDGRRRLRGPRLPDRQLPGRRLPEDPERPGRGRADGLLRRR